MIQKNRWKLGLNQSGKVRPWRNHFVTGPGSDDYNICMSLVERAMLRRGHAVTGDLTQAFPRRPDRSSHLQITQP